MRFTPKPQRDFMATIRQMAHDAMAGRPLIDGPCELTIYAIWLWPASMSRRKRAAPGANLKTTRPDAGNIAKIIEDSLNAIVWTDDARVSDTHIFKRYGDRPGLTVEVRPLVQQDQRSAAA
jgi:Holliday junction resolvase RusA-like endonuclease